MLMDHGPAGAEQVASDLAPCPFCDARMLRYGGAPEFFHPGVITDKDCILSGQGFRAEEAEAWNSRAAPCDRSGEAGETRSGSAEGESAVTSQSDGRRPALTARFHIDQAYTWVNASSASEGDKRKIRSHLESIDASLRQATAPEVYGSAPIEEPWKALKPLPPTDDVRARALREAAEVCIALSGQCVNDNARECLALAARQIAALSAQSPPPSSSGEAEAVRRAALEIIANAANPMNVPAYAMRGTINELKRLAREALSPKADGGNHG